MNAPTLSTRAHGERSASKVDAKKDRESVENPPANTCTLGERLQRWRKTAVFESGKRFQQVILVAPFFELVAELIFPTAVERRYLGGGRFQINDISQLEPWIN